MRNSTAIRYKFESINGNQGLSCSETLYTLNQSTHGENVHLRFQSAVNNPFLADTCTFSGATVCTLRDPVPPGRDETAREVRFDHSKVQDTPNSRIDIISTTQQYESTRKAAG